MPMLLHCRVEPICDCKHDDKIGLQVLILGRSLEGEVDADLKPFVDSGQIAGRPPGTPWRDFLKVLQTAKSLFVPNVHDASPRWAISDSLHSGCCTNKFCLRGNRLPQSLVRRIISF